MAGPRVGVVMWPIQSWRESQEMWLRAEELGFHHGWLYDHTAWRGHTPWYDAYATLAAVAACTTRIGLGTLVTTPNFRDPVPAAHAIKTIDEISGGRLRIGLGAGGTGHTSDGDILDRDWTPAQRSARFAEWVRLLDLLLTSPEASYQGYYWSVRQAVIGVGGPAAPGPVRHRGDRPARAAAGRRVRRDLDMQ